MRRRLDDDSAASPAQKRSKQMDLGTHTRVVAALSLRGDRVWRQLSSAVVGELVDYVQLPTFGAVRVVLPTGQFTGGLYCCAHGDEVYFGDWSHRCLAVYHDDALQRRIGEDELSADGCTVGRDAVLVAEAFANRVSVYPRMGGARLRRFGSYGPSAGELLRPHGLAALGGCVYVAETRRISVFTEDGAFRAHVGASDGQFRPFGVHVDAHEIFVASREGCVRVLRADDLSVERRIGGGVLQFPWDVCVSGGVLFVSDAVFGSRVFAFDAVAGDYLASLTGFEGSAHGVAVRADGTLFVTADDGLTWDDEAGEGRLYAVQLL